MRKIIKIGTIFLIGVFTIFVPGTFVSKAAVAPSVVASWQNPENGPYYYTGETISVKVTTDSAGYTVTGDFSGIEGATQGTYTSTAIDNGNGTYSLSHTLLTTASSMTSSNCGGPVVITVINPSTGGYTVNTDLVAVINIEPREVMPDQKDVSGNFISETTVWKNILDVRAVTNLTFHIPNKGKVVFTKSLDLTDQGVINFIQKLGTYMDMFAGTLKFDASVAAQMKNAGARIEMYNLPYEALPLILVNGQEATLDEVSGISYNKETKTLIFHAKHFSTFKALTKIDVLSPKIKPKKKIQVAGEGLLLKGKVSDWQAKVQIKVNGKLQKKSVKVKKGKFEYNIKLKKGKNTVIIYAKNKIGTPQKKLTIYRTK